MYKYDGVVFTEEDIEKMALEYIELTKEAMQYAGMDILKNSPEFIKFIEEFGGPNQQSNLPGFSQAVKTLMVEQIKNTKGGVTGGANDQNIKTTIVNTTINSAIKIADDILRPNPNKREKIPAVTQFIGKTRPVFEQIYDAAVTNIQAQQPEAAPTVV